MDNLAPIQNVKLSFSCSGNWDAMKPDSLGKYCLSCQKSVIDFRDKDAAFVRQMLEKEGKVCGRFNLKQVIPPRKNFKFSLKLLVASIFLVFGCDIIPEEIKLLEEINPNLAPETEEETMQVFGEFIEILPTYKFGGDEGLHNFLKQNLKYPPGCEDGLVVVKINISETGEINSPKIVKSLSSAADQEVLRIVKLLQFEPAIIAGKPVTSNYFLPVRFKL